MKKWKENIANLDVPKYSTSQDDFNFYSHLLGIPLGIAIIVASIVIYLQGTINIPSLIGLLIFGITASILYSVSSIYHKTPLDSKDKKLKRAIDHSTIYALIAGTYTPICIALLDKANIALIVLILQWSLALIGIFINLYDLKNKYVKAISMVLYIALGWMILFTTLFTYLSQQAFILILLGGISYTLGSILYGIGHKNLWFHSIFHVFVLIGTILQAIGVFYLFF